MKKYILKPGVHQFAPGSAPVHTNENLTDEEAEWYLKKYPHIAELFMPQTSEDRVEDTTLEKTAIVKRKLKKFETSPQLLDDKEGK